MPFNNFNIQPTINNINQFRHTATNKAQNSFIAATSRIAPGIKTIVEDEDMKLWRAYKAGDKSAVWPLLTRFKGTIAEHARKQSNVRPYSVVEAELKQLTIKAFDTYDPSKGAKLITHVINNFKKVSRANIENQHAVRLPENIHFKFRPIVDAQNKLRDSLGRDPTHAELADETGWPLKLVIDANKRIKKELVESKQTYDTGAVESDPTEQALFYAYHTLDNHGKYILEHSIGYGGKPEKSDTIIRRDLGLSPHKYNKAKNGVITMVQQALESAQGDY